MNIIGSHRMESSFCASRLNDMFVNTFEMPYIVSRLIGDRHYDKALFHRDNISYEDSTYIATADIACAASLNSTSTENNVVKNIYPRLRCICVWSRNFIFCPQDMSLLLL